MGTDQTNILHLRLLDDPANIKPKAVHWTRYKRFVGKEFFTSPHMIKSAQHDMGKFKIRDFVAW